MIAGHKRDHRAGNGKTDGINRTYAPVIHACFVIAGQKWRISPLMTLDHAGRPDRRGVSRGNGGNARPVACPGRRPPSSDPQSCPPGTAALQLRGALTWPKLSPAGGPARSRSFASPGGLTVQDRPQRAPDPSRPRDRGEKPERPVPAAGGRGEWRRPAGGCGSPALPAGVPPAEGTRAGAGAAGGSTAGGPAVRARCPAGPRPPVALPRARHRPVPVAGPGRHHDGQRRRPARDREPPPPTPASRPQQPALPVLQPSHGSTDGGQSPLRAALSKPATQAETSEPTRSTHRAGHPAPYMYRCAAVCPAEGRRAGSA